MITVNETCSCGASIQVKAYDVTKTIERWRRHHRSCMSAGLAPQSPAVTPPPWLAPPVIIPVPQPQTPHPPAWWQNPICSTHVTEVVHNHPTEVQ